MLQLIATLVACLCVYSGAVCLLPIDIHRIDTAERLKNACRCRPISSSCSLLVALLASLDASIPPGKNLQICLPSFHSSSAFLVSGFCLGLSLLGLEIPLFLLSVPSVSLLGLPRNCKFFLSFLFSFFCSAQSSSPDPSESPSARPSKSGECPKRSAGFFCCRVLFFCSSPASSFLPSFLSLFSLHSSLLLLTSPPPFFPFFFLFSSPPSPSLLYFFFFSSPELF